MPPTPARTRTSWPACATSRRSSAIPAAEPAAERELRSAIAANPVWYHTLELAPGIATRGWFDLRPILGRLPWPDVTGLRCLDVGTYDGQLAFELESRGAAEVVCTDLASHAEWDWPPDMRAHAPEALTAVVGEEKGAGFPIAKQALGSSVERERISVYELSPERLGSFDVVTCGSLLLHLEEPLRALEAIRSVCGGWFMSCEQIDLRLSALHPRRPLAGLNGSGELCQWWTPNVAGHRRMVFSAGFEIVRATRPYCIPYGAGHPHRGDIKDRRLQRLLTGGEGLAHAALLARPRV